MKGNRPVVKTGMRSGLAKTEIFGVMKICIYGGGSNTFVCVCQNSLNWALRIHESITLISKVFLMTFF